VRPNANWSEGRSSALGQAAMQSRCGRRGTRVSPRRVSPSALMRLRAGAQIVCCSKLRACVPKYASFSSRGIDGRGSILSATPRSWTRSRCFDRGEPSLPGGFLGGRRTRQCWNRLFQIPSARHLRRIRECLGDRPIQNFRWLKIPFQDIRRSSRDGTYEAKPAKVFDFKRHPRRSPPDGVERRERKIRHFALSAGAWTQPTPSQNCRNRIVRTLPHVYAGETDLVTAASIVACCAAQVSHMSAQNRLRARVVRACQMSRFDRSPRFAL